MLLFLQHLFNSYLKEFNTSCFITFDTINYTLSSQFKSRIGVEVYYFDNDEFKTVHCYNLKDEILNQIYTTPEALQMFHNNWDNIKKDDPLIDTNFIVPLYIYSQCQLDKFFEYFIQKYELVNIFTKYDTNQEVMPERWKKVLPQLNYEFQRLNKIYSDSLKDNLTKQLRESLMITYQFHDWYINDKSKEKLDYYMERFIAKINFPYTLS